MAQTQEQAQILVCSAGITGPGRTCMLQVYAYRQDDLEARDLTDPRIPYSNPYLLYIQDPVDSTPAVLVKRYNITQTKEMEQRASVRQSSLEK